MCYEQLTQQRDYLRAWIKRNVAQKSNELKAAFGFKAHSGWAVLVVLGIRNGDLEILERSRVELVEEEWAKQPYHAAENLEPADARRTVKRGIDAAKRIALRELRSAVKRTGESGFEVRDCGLVVGNPMPDWSVEEILAVHFRMHKAEGVLFRDVLAKAADGCELRLVAVAEKFAPARTVRTEDEREQRVAGDSRAWKISRRTVGQGSKRSYPRRHDCATPTREAGVGIKPGVKRSETPGTAFFRLSKPAERSTVESSGLTFCNRTAIGRFAD